MAFEMGQSRTESQGIDGFDISHQSDSDMSDTSNDGDASSSLSSPLMDLSEDEDSRGHSLRKCMRDDRALPRLDQVIVLLMAGAIFGILIAFLIGATSHAKHTPFFDVLAKSG